MAQQPTTNEGETENESMKQLLSVQNVRCFRIEAGNRMVLGNGTLQVLEMQTDTIFLFVPGVFHYAISKSFPSLKAGQSSYVFPGLKNQCFGLVFPAQTPSEDVEMFEALLTQYSQFQEQTIVEDEEDEEEEVGAKSEAKLEGGEKSDEKNKEDKAAKYGKKAAKWIRKGTNLAQIGIKKGTVLAGKGINKSKEYLKTQITTKEEVHVSETTKDRIKKAKVASSAVVKVSKAVVVGATTMCAELASNLADAASKTEIGQKIQNDKSERMEAAKEVGIATLQGALLLFHELEEAALILVGEIADASADVAQYKYGDEVGEVAQDTAEIVKNSASAARNVYDISLEVVAGTTAANTGIQVLNNGNDPVPNTKTT